MEFPRMELELNLTCIFKGGIGIGIESKGFGPESELNWNRLLPELHLIGIKHTWLSHPFVTANEKLPH